MKKLTTIISLAVLSTGPGSIATPIAMAESHMSGGAATSTSKIAEVVIQQGYIPQTRIPGVAILWQGKRDIEVEEEDLVLVDSGRNCWKIRIRKDLLPGIYERVAEPSPREYCFGEIKY